MLKVLHTADWHLGKRLENCERTEEHQYFLDWLIKELDNQSIDVLIIAGDIFDIGSPSNTSLKQYYDFLNKVNSTSCQDVVIIGGNHDSVATLNAPKELLKFFNIHVVGGVPDDFHEQIIPIKDSQGNLKLVVCAVPFLRDRDVRLAIPGETALEMEARIKQGICDHYNKFKELVGNYKASGIPVIATGHLFAAGAINTGSEKDIHVGNLGQICGDQFPEEFDYIALGHLHRPQVVNKMAHIRYSGSPIPLSFSESEDCKVVLTLEFDGGKLKDVTSTEIPQCRKLIRLKGGLDNIKNELFSIQKQFLHLPTWVEVQLETESYIHDLEEQLKTVINKEQRIERIFPRQISRQTTPNLAETTEALDLSDLDVKSVFKQRCLMEYGDEDFSDLIQTFDEAFEQFEAMLNNL
jgi:exonuclease SbcD